MSPAQSEDPRVRFAAERTLLAWIRTGLALMGFGFVVARFGLFLRQIGATVPDPTPPGGWSLKFGVALVLSGILINVLAGVEYRTVLRHIDRGEPYQPPRWSIGMFVVVLLTAVGVAMVAYLLSV